MASRVNHEADYLYVVDGLTLWERLRNIRSFIEEREIAVKISEISMEEADWRMSQLTDSPEDIFEKRKKLVYKDQSMDALQKGRDELEFLFDLEKKLAAEAEKTRIEGKTDEEMYEINYYDELATRIINKATCEVISTGGISPQTLGEAVRYPKALNTLFKIQFLNEEKVANILAISKNKEISYA